jgi:hypothetical protein
LFFITIAIILSSGCRRTDRVANSSPKGEVALGGFSCSELRTQSLAQACRATESLKNELRAGFEKSLDEFVGLAAYYRDFENHQAQNYTSHSDMRSAVGKASQSQVIFSGDIHGDHEVFQTHMTILGQLIDSIGPSSLVCAYEADDIVNKDLAKHAAGKINDSDLRNAHAGLGAFPEKDFRQYFDICRKNDIPFVAVDIDQNLLPEDNDRLFERDRRIAKNIETLVQKFRGKRKIFAPYGSAHLAGSKMLPALLVSKGISTFQFHALASDALHWRCADKLGSEAGLKKVACSAGVNDAYVFSGSSLIVRVRELWSQSVISEDLTTSSQ